MTRCKQLTVFVAVFVLGAASSPHATAQAALVEGFARAEGTDRPIAFALVRLVSADSNKLPSNNPPPGITNGEGRYRFSEVAPGRYRVRLLRIGFEPVLSDPVQVAAGGIAQLVIRADSRAVVLPPLTVSADLCVPAKDLNKYPQIETLWQQARDGASVRTEVMARFRYHVQTHEESVKRKPDGSPTGAVDQSYISDPRSAVRNAGRNRAQRLSRGYYGQTTKDSLVSFFLPSELDVLHEDFLKAHCLVPRAQHGAGEVGLRFLPLSTRRNFLDVGGTIWLDSATFLARRIEFEYMDGDDARGTVRMDFSDIAVAGGTLRMPVGGEIKLRPSRTNPANRSESRFTITYVRFEEVLRR